MICMVTKPPRQQLQPAEPPEDLPTLRTLEEEIRSIDDRKLADPWRKGYEAARKGKARRARECYKGENEVLWYQGYDDALRDAREEADQVINRYNGARRTGRAV